MVFVSIEASILLLQAQEYASCQYYSPSPVDTEFYIEILLWSVLKLH